MRYPDSRLGRMLMSRDHSRYGSPVGNSQDPFGLAGMASGVAKFWLRTSIRTQEQLIALLADQPDKSEAPAPQPQAAPESPPPDAWGPRMRGFLARALDNGTTASHMGSFHASSD